MRTYTIAIDGPAGSGKSTAASKVAARLGFARVDSGSIYRAITYVLLEATGAPLTDASVAAQDVLVGRLAIDVRGTAVIVDGVDVSANLRTSSLTRSASIAARHGFVHEKVHEVQQRLRRSAERGVVVDGRDIGTVVFPNADLKVFLTAERTTRARRRLLQMGATIDDVAQRRIEEEMGTRDDEDTSRAIGPLRRAEDAVVVDNTSLSLDETVQAILDAFNRRVPSTGETFN